MTWRVIAGQDWRLTLGARSVKLLLGLFASGVLLLAYVYPIQAEGPVTTARFPGFVTGWLTTIIPLVGVLLGYNAVVSDRESGALLLSLSLPHSRRDVVLGKLVGRTGPLAATIVGTMALAGALVVYPFGELALVEFAAFVGLTVVFGAVWTGLGIAVSLSVATKRRALVLGFGLFFVLVFVWETAESALQAGLRTAGLGGDALPAATRFVFGLAPGRAFTRVTDGFIDPAATVGGPWYLGEWVGLAVLVGWAVFPIWLSTLWFARRDLA